MNIFYIDVENIGLNFKPLKSEEFKYIIVYHSEKCEKNVQEFKKLYKDIMVEKVLVNGEQAADMKIYDMIYKDYSENKNNNYFVLSRDKGFERFSKISGIPIKALTITGYTRGAIKYLNYISGGLLDESLMRIETLEKENERLKMEYSKNLRVVEEIRELVSASREEDVITVESIKKEVKEEKDVKKKSIVKNIVLKDIEVVEAELNNYNKHLEAKKKIMLAEVIKFWDRNREKKGVEVAPLERNKLIHDINKIIESLKKKKIKYVALKNLKHVVEEKRCEKISDWLQAN